MTPVPEGAPLSSIPEVPEAHTDLDLSIAARKGVHSCKSSYHHPISGVCCLSNLSKTARNLALGIDSMIVPKNYNKAMQNSKWISYKQWTLKP